MIIVVTSNSQSVWYPIHSIPLIQHHPTEKRLRNLAKVKTKKKRTHYPRPVTEDRRKVVHVLQTGKWTCYLRLLAQSILSNVHLDLFIVMSALSAFSAHWGCRFFGARGAFSSLWAPRPRLTLAFHCDGDHPPVLDLIHLAPIIKKISQSSPNITYFLSLLYILKFQLLYSSFYYILGVITFQS